MSSLNRGKIEDVRVSTYLKDERRAEAVSSREEKKQARLRCWISGVK